LSDLVAAICELRHSPTFAAAGGARQKCFNPENVFALWTSADQPNHRHKFQ
jgi:hypothetical protein